MKHIIQITATAFLLILSTLCSADSTNELIVKSVNYGPRNVTIDVGPAVPQYNPDGSVYYVAGMHGEVVGCNTSESSCYAPSVGQSGVLGNGPDVYEGPNVTISWGRGIVATYALHEQY
jgi:hypothetical protein